MLQEIKYPSKRPSVKRQDGKELIFCLSRKKWLLLTPEEWVRQNFLMYLTEVQRYPLALIAVEKQIRLGDVFKRFDILVHDKYGAPFLIVECKEPGNVVDDDVVGQALRYNMKLRAPFLAVTNGIGLAVFEYADEGFMMRESLPALK